MSTMAPSHITIDENGVARIEGTRMKVIHIAEGRRFHGTSPEQMQDQWPDLSLHQIYAALSYYYEHQVEMDEEMNRRSAEVDQMRAQAAPGPTRSELERRRREPGE